MLRLKAKTRRRLKHLLTRKRLVSRRTSHHLMRTASVVIATVCTSSLAYAITVGNPTINVSVNTAEETLNALATPSPATMSSAGETGRGSWYALGLPEPDALTCASRTYPRGTYLLVTDLRNGKQMTCRVNDYGPAIWTGRIIDLSRGSFTQIDSLGTGTIPVHVVPVTAPVGFTLPASAAYGEIVGYNLCEGQFSAAFCNSHRE